MKTQKRNTLQRLCYLAKQLNNSEHHVLNVLQPGFIIKEKKFLKNDFYKDEKEAISKTIFNEVLREVKAFAKYLNCTPIQACSFVAIFARKSNRACDLDNIGRFFHLDDIDQQNFINELEYMVDKNILEKSIDSWDDPNYKIPDIIIDAIRHDISIEDALATVKNNVNQYDFVKKIAKWVEDSDINTGNLFKLVEQREKQYSLHPFIGDTMKMLSDIRDRILFYDICSDFLDSRRRCSDVNDTLSDIFESISERFSVARDLKEGIHPLIKLDLAEIESDGMFSDADIKLTEKGKKLFLEKDIELFTDEKSRQDALIYPDQIAGKTLFYAPELSLQLDLLKENLSNDKFKELQQRLESNALPKGVAAIFYGSPGTGKTETAMQIAKATGRSVFHVDIANSKSCWFGESEKRIKKIFTNYASLCEKEDLKPILLFNEADALFAKRKDSNASNVAQTENAIQNIILEEMEKLNGILIATTNLITNLDGAFARRFLFKIQFNNPTTEAKQSIWKSKLLWLEDKEALTLAQKYNFSGGEIDNIVRKVIMEEVVNGKRPNINDIEDFCRNEKIHGDNTSRIGF
ncbi:MAG: ATP-binding protein [Bacteroidales bacterium]|nr:ATP-binding protein [Bacteroidales bacterium]